MASVLGYYLVFGVIMLIGLAATVMIGFSRQNREGNPDYVRRTAGNWVRLSLFYVLATLFCVALIGWIVYS